jgi:transposase-like protein
MNCPSLVAWSSPLNDGQSWVLWRGVGPIRISALRAFMVSPLTSRHLSFAEREEIAMLKGQGLGVREIARRLGRDPSTVSRAAAQCGNPGRKARLPGLGRAVESGTAGAASQDGETDHQ